MVRIPRHRRRKITPEQLELYTAIAHGPRSSGQQNFPFVAPDGALNGPFNAFILSLRLGDALQRLGAVIRFNTGISDRIRDIAILLVATCCGGELGLIQGEMTESSISVNAPRDWSQCWHEGR